MGLVPPLAVWCGLEAYDPEADAWLRLDLPGVGRWWRVAELQPEQMAAQLNEQGALPAGTYRAAWARQDRRSTLDSGEPFEVAEAGGGSNPDPPPQKRQSLSGPPVGGGTIPGGAASAARDSTSEPRSPTPPRRPQIAVPFEPPAPHEQSPLATFVYLQALAESERNRQHQQVLQMMSLMVSTVEARAAAAIEAERARCDHYLALSAPRTTGAEQLAAPLQELQRAITEIREDQDADREEAAQAQMVQLAGQEPEGFIQAVGTVLQSPGGQIIADGLGQLLRRLASGGAQPPEGPPYDPVG